MAWARGLIRTSSAQRWVHCLICCTGVKRTYGLPADIVRRPRRPAMRRDTERQADVSYRWRGK